MGFERTAASYSRKRLSFEVADFETEVIPTDLTRLHRLALLNSYKLSLSLQELVSVSLSVCRYFCRSVCLSHHNEFAKYCLSIRQNEVNFVG